MTPNQCFLLLPFFLLTHSHTLVWSGRWKTSLPRPRLLLTSKRRTDERSSRFWTPRSGRQVTGCTHFRSHCRTTTVSSSRWLQRSLKSRNGDSTPELAHDSPVKVQSANWRRVVFSIPRRIFLISLLFLVRRPSTDVTAKRTRRNRQKRFFFVDMFDSLGCFVDVVVVEFSRVVTSFLLVLLLCCRCSDLLSRAYAFIHARRPLSPARWFPAAAAAVADTAQTKAASANTCATAVDEAASCRWMESENFHA